MGNALSGNRSILIDYDRKERICTGCKEKKSFKSFGWDKRRNCPKAECKKCISIKNRKYYQDKSMKGRSDARE